MKQKTKMVLSYIKNNSGTATTHDLTVDTQIDDNDAARYQLKKLADEGYVELSKVDEGHFEVTQARLTTEGKNTADTGLSDLNRRLNTNTKALAELIQDLDEAGVIDIEEYREQFSN